MSLKKSLVGLCLFFLSSSLLLLSPLPPARADDPPPANAIRIESDDGRVLPAGNWTSQPDSAASGGLYLLSSGSADDMLTLHFSGSSVSISAVRGPALGTLVVEIDRTVVRTVPLLADEMAFETITTISYLDERQHVLRVYGLAGPVAVDAFIATPAAAPSRPATMSLDELSRYDYTQIIVKFREGSDIRLRNGHLRAVNGDADVQPVAAVLQHVPAAAEPQLGRLFTRTETELAAERRAAEAAIAHAEHLPDLNLYYLIRLAEATPLETAQQLLADLNALSIVQTAYPQPLVTTGSSGGDLLATPNFEAMQGYLAAAPAGVDARFAWEQPGGQGQGVTVVDIEGGWHLSHEDLPLNSASLLSGINLGDPGGREHGTAVVGIIAARRNGYGVTGIAYRSQVKLVSIFGNSEANAVNIAAANTQPGDIITIQLQALGPPSGQSFQCDEGQFEHIPLEYWQANFDAIKIATASGRIVVELGGNGAMNLDAPRYGNRFQRTFRNSGAILVAAATRDTRQPICPTNYGSRFDLMSWGEQVTSTGIGNFYSGGAPELFYTDGFRGTSSSTAIVAGVAASLQGMAKARGFTLTAAEMDLLLIQTGTPQGSSSKYIGRQPDLRAAYEHMTSCEPRPLVNHLSISSSGQAGNSSSYYPDISADGRFVAFTTAATNLASGDTNGRYDVMVRDTKTCLTTRISASNGGVPSNGSTAVDRVGMSADGRLVVFASDAADLVGGDGNHTSDIFLYDRYFFEVYRVSISSSGAEGNGPASQPAISAGGRYIAFTSEASNLVSGDSNGLADVFVRDTWTGLTSRVSVSSAGVQGDGFSSNPAISDDGRYVIFESNASNLVGDDTNGTTDVFVRDRTTGQTFLISRGMNGESANGLSLAGDIAGNQVVFSSLADNLVAGDSNGVMDIFLYELSSASLTRLSETLDGAESDGSAFSPRFSPDGRLVAYYSSTTTLDPTDTNGQMDIYANDLVYGGVGRASRTHNNGQLDQAATFPVIANSGYAAFHTPATNMLPAGNTPYFDIFTVRVPLTGTVYLQSPNVSAYYTLPTYRWDAALNWGTDPGADATWYQLLIADSGGKKLLSRWYEATKVCANSLCSVQPYLPLGMNTTYQWWVRPYAASYGTLDWFGPESFSLAQPVPLSPTHTVTNPHGYIEFSWRALDEGETHYQIYLFKDSSYHYDLWVDAASHCTGGICRIRPSDNDESFLLDSGNYIWYLHFWGPQGHGTWSSGRSFTLSAVPLDAVTKLGPLEEDSFTDNSVQFSWEENPDAVAYEISLLKPDGTTDYRAWSRADGVTCGAGVCTLQRDLTQNGTYTWYVRAMNAAGGGKWSPLNSAADSWGAVSFNLNAPTVDVVTKLAPLQGEVINNDTITFEWQQDPHATAYEVSLVRPDGTANYRPWDEASGVTCDAGVCSLQIDATQNGIHTWYLRAMNAVSSGLWSPLNSSADGWGAVNFTVNAPLPQAVSPIVPAQNVAYTQNQVTFSWHDTAHAEVYAIYVGGPQNYGMYAEWEVGEDIDCSGGVCTKTLLLPYDGSYSWWRQAINRFGGGPWSADPPNDEWGKIDFTVDAPAPGLVTKLAPPAGVVETEMTVAFHWTSIPEASQYELYLAGPGGFKFHKALPVGSDVLCAADCVYEMVVPANGTYTWYLRALNSHGGGPWSANPPADNYGATTFSVDVSPPGPATQLSPVDGSIVIDNGEVTTFEWQPVSNTTHYNLVLVDFFSGSIQTSMWYAAESVCQAPANCSVAYDVAPGSYRWAILTWWPGLSSAPTYVPGLTPTWRLDLLGL